MNDKPREIKDFPMRHGRCANPTKCPVCSPVVVYKWEGYDEELYQITRERSGNHSIRHNGELLQSGVISEELARLAERNKVLEETGRAWERYLLIEGKGSDVAFETAKKKMEKAGFQTAGK